MRNYQKCLPWLTVAAAVLAAGCDVDLGSAEAQSDPAGEALVAEIAALEAAVARAAAKLERLHDIDEIENLAGIYGHYVDKSMQDDIADLFARDGVVEILGRGVFLGQARAREYMHNLGPVGPREGSLFNHMHLQPVVHVSDDGRRAHVRSRLLVMFGIHEANAQWGAGIYENVLVKQDGVWKYDYLHAYQTFYTNYEDGWANRASGIFAPYERLPPDLPQSVAYDPYPAAFVPPFHYANPVSGRDDYTGSPEWAGPREPGERRQAD
jgi:hypothetical protein